MHGIVSCFARKSTTIYESGHCALVLRQCKIVILMPDLMRTSLLHTLPPLLRVNQLA